MKSIKTSTPPPLTKLAVALLSTTALCASLSAADSAIGSVYHGTTGGEITSAARWFYDEALTQAVTTSDYPNADTNAYIIGATGKDWISKQTDTYFNDLIVSNTAGFTIGFGSQALNSEYTWQISINNLKIQSYSSPTTFHLTHSFDNNEGHANLQYNFNNIEVGYSVYGEPTAGASSCTARLDIGGDGASKATSYSVVNVANDIKLGGSNVSGAALINVYADEVNVGGTIWFHRNGTGYNNITFQTQSALTVGGLETDETVTQSDYCISNKSNATFDSSITFTTAAGKDYLYRAAITDNGASVVGSGTGKVNLVMDGEGTQRIIQNVKNATINGRHSGSITVKKGKLFYENSDITEENRLATLVIDGGKFGTSAAVMESIGNAYLASAEFKGSGGFAFERLDAQNAMAGLITDQINIAGEFKKSSENKIVVDFADASGNALNFSEHPDIVSSAEEIYIWIDLLNAGSLNGFDLEDANKDFVAVGIEDMSAVFQWINNDNGGYNLQVGFFTAVPEPATMAAVLGALALGLAIFRRRK